MYKKNIQMKKGTLLLLALILLSSCGGDSKSVDKVIESGNLESIRAKRVEIVAKQTEINNTLSRIDQAISKLDTNKKYPLVTAITASESSFNHFLEIQGSVETKQNIVIYPEFSGLLTKIHVKDGDRVSKGALIATIDDGGLSQQLAQMEVMLSLSKTTYERQQKLWDQQIGSEIEFLQAKANYEGQQNAVNQMRSQVAKTKITAPFSGIIDDVITEQGTVVAAGQSQIVRLVNLEDMYIQAEIPESYLNDVTVGKNVEVFFPVLGKTIQAKIRQVSNYISPTNRTFKIEITVPNKDKTIKPNLTARLKINDYINANALLIPQSVISENANGEQYLYITNASDTPGISIAKKIIVTTGKTQGDYVEIKEGIKNGDTIIVEGARSVKEGQEVEILSVDTNE